jgi:hypothetical protein
VSLALDCRYVIAYTTLNLRLPGQARDPRARRQSRHDQAGSFDRLRQRARAAARVDGRVTAAGLTRNRQALSTAAWAATRSGG